MLFQVIAGWQGQPVAALVQPDASGLFIPGEVAMFWIQHVLAAAFVPAVYLMQLLRVENKAGRRRTYGQRGNKLYLKK